MNASEGVYNKAHWEFGATISESLTSILLDASNTVMSGQLTISNDDTDLSIIDIDLSKIETISGSGLLYQSFPKSNNDIITIKNQNDTVMLSMLGNEGDSYSIDDDILIDSNLDSIADNDDDNKDDPSYTDGSLYIFQNLDSKNKRERKIQLTVKKNGAIISTRTVTIVLDYIAAEAEKGIDLSGS